MKLQNYLDLHKLKEHVDAGLVSCVTHPSLPLVIFCYSRKAVLENIWDDITTKTRGLIVDDKGEVVSRSFEKFFNLSQMDRPETWLSNLPSEKPQILEKLNGSLGILYRYEGYTGISTKGSFSSDQAFWATGFYQEHHKDATWPLGYTPVFEIIAESVQAHAVHYGTDKLVLISLINNETGEEASYEDIYYWGNVNNIEVADIYDKTVGDVLNEDRKNHEGYVLNWPRPGQTPLKIKVKHPGFLALRKVVHAATPKGILEAFIDGRESEVESWASETNGKIGEYVRRWAAEFRGQYGHALLHVVHMVRAAEGTLSSRKEFAEFFNRPENKLYSAAAFAMIDRKDKEQVTKLIWKIVQAKVETVTEEQTIPAFADEEEPS